MNQDQAEAAYLLPLGIVALGTHPECLFTEANGIVAICYDRSHNAETCDCDGYPVGDFEFRQPTAEEVAAIDLFNDAVKS